jgi:cell division protein FtsL
MTRVNVLLALLLILSALYLVRTSYESRRLFAELDKARTDATRLAADYKRLEAEAQLQSTHVRVDRTARDKLGMRTATPGVTTYVVDPQAAAPVASAPASAGAAR